MLRERGFSMRANLTGASLAQTKLKKWLATPWGVVMARKGGVSPDPVIKTLGPAGFSEYRLPAELDFTRQGA